MTAIGWAARIRRHAPALLGLAIFLAFVAPVLAPGVQLYYRDTGRLYYPVKLYIAQALAHGRIAWWDPIGRPNARRSANWSVRSNARCIAATDPSAMRRRSHWKLAMIR